MICAVVISYLMGLEIQKLILICLAGDAILLMWILVQIGVPVPFLSVHKSLAEIKKFIPFCAPLIFSSLFLWFTRSIDRFLIVQLLGLASVGIYGVALQIASLVFIVLRPINFVLFPRTSSAWNQGDKEDVDHYFSQAITLTLISSLPLIVGIFMTSNDLITLIAGESYQSSKALGFCLLLSCVASMVYQNHLYVIQLVEKTYLLPILFISTTMLNIVLGYFFITKVGLLGAAISRVLTLTLMAIVVTMWARHHVKFHINWDLVWRVGLASLLMGLAINWFPVDSWGNLMMKIVTGSAIFVASLFLVGVVSKENLIMLKNQL